MAEAVSNSSSEDTFPKLLLRNAVKYARRPAIREKDLGIWQSWNWAEVLEEVRAYSIGLEELGLKRGDKIAVIGANRPRLYWTFPAAQALGAIPVPVYADSVAEELAYVLNHAEVRFAVCEDQEQVDKIMSIAEEVPSIELIIYDDDSGLHDYEEDHLHAYEDIRAQGRAKLDASPETEKAWLAEIDKSKGSDVSVMLYTSGTTGRPKGVMLTYDNLAISARNAIKFEGLDETEETIAYLPIAWVGDHVFSYAQQFIAGYCVCCPESAETVFDDRREIAPTYYFGPPKIFELMLTMITVRMQDASRIKQKIFNYFLDVAKKSGEKILNGETVPFMDRLLYGIGQFVVYGPLRNQMGLTRMKLGYTAGEAIGPEMFQFYRSLGLNLKQLYGQTEASVYVTIQKNGEIYADTVGTPAIDVELKLTEGEVLFRSPGVFAGYYKNDEATRETKTEDGWVHTGDAGLILPNGHLKIIDRAKDVGQLTNGSLFAPKYIENKLKFFPNIGEAVAFGDGREFCTAFINIDLTAVGNWAERSNIMYSSYQELANHPQVYGMIAEHIDEVNKILASEGEMADSQVRRFLILHKELDADDGELTRTLKVRRKFVNERYEDLINSLYDGSTEKFVTTEVTFEDGKRGEISATVKIHDMDVHPSSGAHQEAAE